MSMIERDRLFTGLTRPQMLLGVTYSYVVANGIITTELFLVFKSPWVFLIALVAHFAGYFACLKEPRFFDLWLIGARVCPRIKNFKVWRCNSYRA